MLMVCCDTSLITVDSFTTKIEVIVGRIWYILYSCLARVCVFKEAVQNCV